MRLFCLLLLFSGTVWACSPSAINIPQALSVPLGTQDIVSVVKGHYVQETEEKKNKGVFQVDHSFGQLVEPGIYRVFIGGPLGNLCEYGEIEMESAYLDQYATGLRYLLVSKVDKNGLIIPLFSSQGLSIKNGQVYSPEPYKRRAEKYLSIAQPTFDAKVLQGIALSDWREE